MNLIEDVKLKNGLLRIAEMIEVPRETMNDDRLRRSRHFNCKSIITGCG